MSTWIACAYVQTDLIQLCNFSDHAVSDIAHGSLNKQENYCENFKNLMSSAYWNVDYTILDEIIALTSFADHLMII